MFYQITKPRLRLLDAHWHTVLQRFCGPVPPGLGIAHMVAESNGSEDPTVRDMRRQPVGLMQISQSDGLRYGYQPEQLRVPRINLYVWCCKTNADSQWLRATYPSYWPQPTNDFWLIVRLLFILGQKTLDALLTDCSDVGSKTQNILLHLTTTSKRYGPYTAHTLRRIAAHLHEVNDALTLLHGPRYTATGFYQTPLQAPGTDMTVLDATVKKG